MNSLEKYIDFKIIGVLILLSISLGCYQVESNRNNVESDNQYVERVFKLAVRIPLFSKRNTELIDSTIQSVNPMGKAITMPRNSEKTSI